jgi:endonuclease/exonuclease/phosphatase family metal-dependent hydrolase
MTLRKKLLLIATLIIISLGIWILNVSRPSKGPRGCPRGCVADAGRLEGPLRVISLNVLHGHPDFENLESRMKLIADEILSHDADIVLLQEVPWTFEFGEVAETIAQRCGMNYLYMRSNGNRWAIFFEEGSAILSRYPLKNASFQELRPQAEFFEHRFVLYATVVTDWGDLDVFVTHLTDGADEINRKQAEALQDFVESTGSAPAIVGGDFNALENETQILTLSEDWEDAYRAIHAGDAGFTCCIDDLAADPSESLEKRIDYVFVVPRPGLTISVRSAEIIFDQPTSVNSGWLWASDHLGLLIEIEILPESNKQ